MKDLILDDAMDSRISVSISHFASTESPEVFSSYGDNRIEELEDNLACFLAADRDLKEDL